MVIHFLHAGRTCATLPGTEESMTTTIDFITAFFCQVDDHLPAIPKYPEAHLWPSEVGTLGLLHARKGVGNRPFYRWLTRDYRALFPRLPERTRLFRLLKTHQDWIQAFLAAPTFHPSAFSPLGVKAPPRVPWVATVPDVCTSLFALLAACA